MKKITLHKIYQFIAYGFLVKFDQERDKLARRQQKYFTVGCVVLFLLTRLL